MAIWQWCIRVDLVASPPNAAEAFLARLDPILRPQKSWSSETRQWGDLASNVCEAVFTDERLDDILMRIDMRDDWRSHLHAFWELADQTGCRLVTHDGDPLHSLEEAAFAASSSDAAKFADDPHEFLGGSG